MANLPLRSLTLPGNENVYGIGGEYEVSNIGELKKVMKNALPGSVIHLSNNQTFECLKIVGQNQYPENLTITGGTLAGVSITSGIKYSDIFTDGNCDITKAILPKGLKFSGVKFTDSFSLRNARIDDLTIENCTFEGSNIYITPEGFNDSYGSDSNDAASYRRPYAHVGQKNLTISECKFIDAIGYQGMKENANGSITKTGTGSGIHILGVNGVTIYKNHINGKMLAEKSCGIHDGIQVGGYPGSAGKDPVDVYSSGEIKIIANTIDTIGSRAINISSVKNANITVSNNDCFNINKQDRSGIQPIRIQSSINTTIDFTINEPYHEEGLFNTWDKSEEEDKRITTENGGIKVQNITFPTTPSSLLRYSDDNKENESGLDKWLEGVFKDLPDYSYTDIAIQCPGIRGSSHTMVGKLYKQSASGIVDVIEHLSGNHFTKTRDWSANNGAWNRTRFCPEQQIAGIYESIETLNQDKKIAIYYIDEGEGLADPEQMVDNWLNNILESMENNTSKSIYIDEIGFINLNIYPFSEITGTLYKTDESSAQLIGTVEINDVLTTVKKVFNNSKWSSFSFNLSDNYDDYVVSQGVDGIWSCRLWNSGDKECWCHYKYTPSSAAEIKTLTIELPGPFIDNNYIVQITKSHHGLFVNNVTVCDSQGNINQITPSSFPLTYQYNASGIYPVGFYIYVKGKWK